MADTLLASQPPVSQIGDEVSAQVLIHGLYEDSAEVGTLERRRLARIRALQARGVWIDDDCRDMYQWVAQHLGIGTYRSRKLVDCSIAIESLPRISEALESGLLSLDKVVELSRFATPETEAKLITWARRVSPAAIRNRAQELAAKDREEANENRNDRFLRWSIDEDKLWLEGLFPADVGVPMISVIQAHAARLAPAPADERPGCETNPEEQRCADALAELVLTGSSNDAGGRAVVPEVFVHTKLDSLGFGSGVDASGLVLHPDVMQRLTCDCRLRFVLTDESGNASGIGEASRTIPYWLRQAVLKAYDFTCVFPGCECRRYLDAHHVTHWSHGGPTDNENLIPLCFRHHSLVHEHGWSAYRGTKGTVIWYRPDGREYLPGPEPPDVDQMWTTT
jgi:hypothetical protein